MKEKSRENKIKNTERENKKKVYVPVCAQQQQQQQKNHNIRSKHHQSTLFQYYITTYLKTHQATE